MLVAVRGEMLSAVLEQEQSLQQLRADSVIPRTPPTGLSGASLSSSVITAEEARNRSKCQ